MFEKTNCNAQREKTICSEFWGVKIALAFWLQMVNKQPKMISFTLDYKAQLMPSVREGYKSIPRCDLKSLFGLL